MSKYSRFWFTKMVIMMVLILIGFAYGCFVVCGDAVISLIGN